MITSPKQLALEAGFTSKLSKVDYRDVVVKLVKEFKLPKSWVPQALVLRRIK